jgi:hypothetical protein
VLTRLLWALANSGLWLGCGATAILAAISPDPEVRVLAVIGSLCLAVGWTAHMLADHYDDVTDENEILSGRRDVVFGATEEAKHAAVVAFPEQWRRARALMHRRRHRAHRRLVVGFDPAVDNPGVVVAEVPDDGCPPRVAVDDWEVWADALSRG